MRKKIHTINSHTLLYSYSILSISSSGQKCTAVLHCIRVRKREKDLSFTVARVFSEFHLYGIPYVSFKFHIYRTVYRIALNSAELCGIPYYGIRRIPFPRFLVSQNSA